MPLFHRTAARRRVFLTTLVLSSLVIASAVLAQEIMRGGRRRGIPDWAYAQDFDGSFLYCRAYYTSVLLTGSGSGWDTDYPAADNNFLVRLGELTRVRLSY